MSDSSVRYWFHFVEQFLNSIRKSQWIKKLRTKKLPKQNKLKDKARKRKKSQGLFCVDQVLQDMGPDLGYDWFTQWHSIRGSWFSPLVLGINANSFLVRRVGLCLFSALSAGTSFGLNLCMLPQSLWAYVFISPTVSGGTGMSSIPFSSYNLSAPSLCSF